jgi:hypothetical protein
MKKIAGIILILTVKILFPGGEDSYAKKQIARSIAVQRNTAVCGQQVISDSRQSDPSPETQRKKRVKGISCDLLPIRSERTAVLFFPNEKQLLAYNPSVSLHYYLCNAKRGPPSASISL